MQDTLPQAEDSTVLCERVQNDRLEGIRRDGCFGCLGWLYGAERQAGDRLGRPAGAAIISGVRVQGNGAGWSGLEKGVRGELAF